MQKKEETTNEPKVADVGKRKERLAGSLQQRLDAKGEMRKQQFISKEMINTRTNLPYTMEEKMAIYERVHQHTGAAHAFIAITSGLGAGYFGKKLFFNFKSMTVPRRLGVGLGFAACFPLLIGAITTIWHRKKQLASRIDPLTPNSSDTPPKPNPESKKE